LETVGNIYREGGVKSSARGIKEASEGKSPALPATGSVEVGSGKNAKSPGNIRVKKAFVKYTLQNAHRKEKFITGRVLISLLRRRNRGGPERARPGWEMLVKDLYCQRGGSRKTRPLSLPKLQKDGDSPA